MDTRELISFIGGSRASQIVAAIYAKHPDQFDVSKVSRRGNTLQRMYTKRIEDKEFQEKKQKLNENKKTIDKWVLQQQKRREEEKHQALKIDKSLNGNHKYKIKTHNNYNGVSNSNSKTYQKIYKLIRNKINYIKWSLIDELLTKESKNKIKVMDKQIKDAFIKFKYYSNRDWYKSLENIFFSSFVMYNDKISLNDLKEAFDVLVYDLINENDEVEGRKEDFNKYVILYNKILKYVGTKNLDKDIKQYIKQINYFIKKNKQFIK